jgi:heme A synthase
MKNSPLTVAIHLGNAELVLGAALVVALWAARVVGGSPRPASQRGTAMIAAALGSAYLIVVTGAVVVGTGASLACPSWPLCGGQGARNLMDLHMLHRVVVLVGSTAILGAAYLGASRWRGRGLGTVARLTAGLLVAEVVVGAVQVLGGLPAGLRSLHVAVASGVWSGTVLMAAGVWLERLASPADAQAGSRRLGAARAEA